MSILPVRTLGALGPQQGSAVRVDGFPGRCRKLNTVSIRSTGYLGPVTIEAALTNDPQETDWRPISTETFDTAPSTLGLTLRGKFVWLRIRYDETLPGMLDSAIVR